MAELDLAKYRQWLAWGQLRYTLTRTQLESLVAAQERAEQVEAAVQKFGVRPLQRLSSIDEMAGEGVLEEMTGAPKAELLTRMRYAGAHAEKLRAALAAAPVPRREEDGDGS